MYRAFVCAPSGIFQGVNTPLVARYHPFTEISLLRVTKDRNGLSPPGAVLGRILSPIITWQVAVPCDQSKCWRAVRPLPPLPSGRIVQVREGLLPPAHLLRDSGFILNFEALPEVRLLGKKSKDHRRTMLLPRFTTVSGCCWYLLGMSLLLGCGESESITRYEAPKPVKVEAPSTRTLGAIVPLGDQAWFFKLTGLSVQVATATDSFREFMETVKFNAIGNPEWPLPEGWRERPGDSIRYRTVLLSTDVNPLEISITRLPLPEGDLDDYLLSNINRWRDQLSLGPLVKEELSRHMETASLDGELPLYLVDFEGQGMGRMTGMPPMASGPGPAAGSSAGRPAAGRPTGERSPGASGEGVGGSTSPSGSPESEIAYEAPSHWKDMGAGGFRQASFRVDEGEDSAEVTVIALGPNSGSVLENVNRWRQQVKLEPLATSQLDGETQLIDAQNSQGTYVVLHGSGGGISRSRFSESSSLEKIASGL
jgi:hypothetical protein